VHSVEDRSRRLSSDVVSVDANWIVRRLAMGSDTFTQQKCQTDGRDARESETCNGIGSRNKRRLLPPPESAGMALSRICTPATGRRMAAGRRSSSRRSAAYLLTKSTSGQAK